MFKLELKKLFANSKIWLIVFTIFIVSLSLLQLELRFSNDPRISSPILFKEIINEVDDSTEELNLYSQYESFQIAEFNGNSLENYDQKLVKSYRDIVRDKGDSYINNRLKILYFINNEAYHLDFNEYTSDILESLSNLDRDNSLVLRIEKYYADLNVINVERTDSLFLDALFSQKTFNIGIVLMIVVIVSLLFNIDKQSELSSVIYLTKTGKNKILFWKYVAGLVLIVFFMLILFSFNIYILMFKFGFEFFNTPIQSFYSFFSSPFMLNTFHFLLSLILSNLLYILFIYTLLWLTCSLFDNSQIGVITLIFTYFISMLLTIIIPSESILIALKHFNLYALGLMAQSLSIFSSFTILGISNVLPVLINLLMVVSSIMFMILLLVITETESYFKLSNVKFKTRFKKLLESNNESLHEHYKILVMEYNWLIFSLIVISILFFNFSILNTKQSTFNKDLSNYLSQHGGLINDNLLEFYADEESKYLEFENNYKEDMDKVLNLELDRELFDKKYPEIEKMKWDSYIFNGANNKLKSSSKYLIDTEGIDILVSQYSFINDYVIALIIIVGSIGMFSNVMAIDKRNRELDVYSLTISGKKSIYQRKFFILIETLAFILIFLIIHNIIIFNKYSVSLNDVTFFDIANQNVLPKIILDNTFVMDMKLSHYLVLLNIIRLVGSYFVLISIFTISKFVNTRSSVFIITLLLFVISSFMFLAGFEIFSYLNVFDLIAGNIYFWSHSTLTKVFIVFVFNIILTKVFLFD